MTDIDRLDTTSARMRELIDRGLGMTRDMYVSPELFDLEMTGILGRGWQYAGHVSQLAEPGQYLAVDLGPAGVIVSRGDDGRLAAFHNVCRHRGARLVEPGAGQVRRFVCPYHQWTYRTDGTLRGAPKMGDDFCAQDYPLVPAQVDTWEGLVFVNTADRSHTSIGELMSPALEIVAPFDLATARVAHTIDYQVAANWKIVWENAQECYHCTANHPEFLRSVDVSPLADDSYTATAIVRTDDCKVQSTRFPLKPGAVSLTMDGGPASRVPMGRFAAGHEPYTAAAHLKPTFVVVCSPDYAMVLAERPVSVRRTDVSVSWLVAAGAEEGRDFQLADLIKVWDSTNRQDWDLCERTQRGVDSPWYQPGPLAPEEASVGAFHHAYAQMLAEAEL